MRKNPVFQSGFINPRVIFAFALCSAGVVLAMFSFAAASAPSGNASVAAPSVLLARAAGSWSIVSSPNVNVAGQNSIYSVNCPSASDCWAVGAYYTGSAYQTLIEHWNGTSWTIGSSPNPGSAYNVLYGVTCASTSDCWAVGYYQGTQTNNLSRTLIERWNGTSWSIVTSPNQTSPVPNNYLNSVTCTSATNCWAVGYYFVNIIFVGPGVIGTSLFQTLIEHWDGTSWTVVPSPNTSTTQTNILTGATCTSASNCWAVGYYYSASSGGIPGLTQTLTQHWNGASWTIVPSPNILAAEDHVLTGVTCPTATDCWAVGYHYISSYAASPIYQTLIERWNGTSWSIIASPNTSPTQQNVLFGATCTSASECWAVGFYVSGEAGLVNAFFQTLIERWDGNAWNIVTSPNTSPAQSNLLYGVGCASAYDCWAMGHYMVNGVPQTLAEHYTAPQPLALVSAASRKIHGNAGPFEINLPFTGTLGIECRTGGADGEYTIVFTFTNPVTSVDSASTSCGSISSRMVDGSNARRYIVNTTGCTGNAQSVTVTVTGVHDNAGNTLLSAPAIMGVLRGDTTANRVVNSSDISQTKAQSGASTSAASFRADVTVNGVINSSDISLVKSKSGTALP